MPESLVMTADDEQDSDTVLKQWRESNQFPWNMTDLLKMI